MRRKIVAVIVSMVLTAGGFALHAAASTPCAGFSVTAPVVGTVQHGECSPVSLPSQFDTGLLPDICATVSPAHTIACANASVYLVTP